MKGGLTLSCLLLPLLFACSGSPPGIVNTDWMVVYTHNPSPGTVSQELNFFVQLQDDDGFNDIAELYLIRDDLNWSWKIDSSNWVSYEEDDEYWIGANGLTIGRRGDIPEGSFRLLVIDQERSAG